MDDIGNENESKAIPLGELLAEVIEELLSSTQLNKFIYSFLYLVSTFQSIHSFNNQDISIKLTTFYDFFNTIPLAGFWLNSARYFIVEEIIVYLVLFFLIVQIVFLLIRLKIGVYGFLKKNIFMKIITLIFIFNSTIFLVPIINFLLSFSICKESFSIYVICSQNSNVFLPIIFILTFSFFIIYILIFTCLLIDYENKSNLPWKMQNEKYRFVLLFSKILFNILYLSLSGSFLLFMAFSITQLILLIYFVYTSLLQDRILVFMETSCLLILGLFYFIKSIESLYSVDQENFIIILIISLSISLSIQIYSKYQLFLIHQDNPYILKNENHVNLFFRYFYSMIIKYSSELKFSNSMTIFLTHHMSYCQFIDCTCKTNPIPQIKKDVYEKDNLDKMRFYYGKILSEMINKLLVLNPKWNELRIIKIDICENILRKYYLAYYEISNQIIFEKHILQKLSLIIRRKRIIQNLKISEFSLKVKTDFSDMYGFVKCKRYQLELILSCTASLSKLWECIINKDFKIKVMLELSKSAINILNKLDKVNNQFLSKFKEYYLGQYLYALFQKYVMNNFSLAEVYFKYAESYESKFNSLSKKNSNLSNFSPNSDTIIIAISMESDSLGIITLINDKVTSRLGYDPEKLIGKNISKIMPRFIAEKHDLILRDFKQTGEISSLGKEKMLFVLNNKNFVDTISIIVAPLMKTNNKLEFIALIRNHPSEICRKFYSMPYDSKDKSFQNIITNSNFIIEGVNKKVLNLFGLPTHYLEKKKNLFSEQINIFKFFTELSKEDFPKLLNVGKFINLNLSLLKDFVDRDYLTEEEFHYFEKSIKFLYVFLIVKEFSLYRTSNFYSFAFVNVSNWNDNKKRTLTMFQNRFLDDISSPRSLNEEMGTLQQSSLNSGQNDSIKPKSSQNENENENKNKNQEGAKVGTLNESSQEHNIFLNFVKSIQKVDTTPKIILQILYSVTFIFLSIFLISTYIFIDINKVTQENSEVASFIKSINSIQGNTNFALYGFLTEVNIANGYEKDMHNNINRSATIRTLNLALMKIIGYNLKEFILRINQPRYGDLLANLTKIMKSYQTISSKSKTLSANTPFINAIERMSIAALALMPLSDDALISPAFKIAYIGNNNLNFLDRSIFEVVGNLINNYTTSTTLARLYSVTYSQSLVFSYIFKLIIEICIIIGIILLSIVFLSILVKKLYSIIQQIIYVIISLPRNTLFEYTQLLSIFHKNLSKILLQTDKNLNKEERKQGTQGTQNLKKKLNQNSFKSILKDTNNPKTKPGKIKKLSSFIELFENIKEETDNFEEATQEAIPANDVEMSELILKINVDFSSYFQSLIKKIIPFYCSILMSLLCCIYYLIILIYFNSVIPAALNNYIMINNRTVSFSILSIDYKAHLMNFYQYFRKNDRDPFIRFFEMFETTEHDISGLKLNNDPYFKPYFERKLIQDSQDFCSSAVLYKWINTSVEYCKTVNYGKFGEGFDTAINYYAFTMERNFNQMSNNNHSSTFISNVMKSDEFTEMVDGLEHIISSVLLSNDVFASEIVDYTINLFWYYGLSFYLIILLIFIVTLIVNFVITLVLIKKEILNYQTLLCIIPGKAMINENIKERIQKCISLLQ